jgi:hypothetical protein
MQIMKDASVENIDTPQCRTEPTSKDFNNSTEREHHLHQIFITKNRVLCGEVQKTFREFMHADENTEHHIEWENKDLPNRLQDINDYQFRGRFCSTLWCVYIFNTGIFNYLRVTICDACGDIE